MGKFYDTHPNLKGAKDIDANGTKYTKLNAANTEVIEQWTKVNGEWIDTTRGARIVLNAILQKKRKDYIARKRLNAVLKDMTEHSLEADREFKNFIIGGKQ